MQYHVAALINSSRLSENLRKTSCFIALFHLPVGYARRQACRKIWGLLHGTRSQFHLNPSKDSHALTQLDRARLSTLLISRFCFRDIIHPGNVALISEAKENWCRMFSNCIDIDARQQTLMLPFKTKPNLVTMTCAGHLNISSCQKIDISHECNLWYFRFVPHC